MKMIMVQVRLVLAWLLLYKKTIEIYQTPIANPQIDWKEWIFITVTL